MKTPFLFIGQAPPEHQGDVPFGTTHLYKWLQRVGIEKDDAAESFAFTALVDFFPGFKGKSHRVPSDDEIDDSHPRLVKLIQEVQPRVIVTVGVHSARRLLANSEVKLQDIVGKRFAMRPFQDARLPQVEIIPLPHPSGASTWVYMHDNSQRLESALELIAQAYRRGE